LREIFPKFGVAELKESIFIGPKNRERINDDLFEHLLTKTEESAWLKFRAVCINLLGNIKALNCKEIVEDLLNAYQYIRCSMSLRTHLLHSHLYFFPKNLGTVSDEHGERFHQDISNIEKRYAGKWSQHVLADDCWNLTEEISVASYRRMSSERSFKRE
jgi:hypothetical protein